MNFAFAKGSSSREGKPGPEPGFKVFLRSHVEWLHNETLKIARETSSATAEVWLNRYEVNAQKRQRDAARWEHWEATSGRAKLFPNATGATSRRHPSHDDRHILSLSYRTSPSMSGSSSPSSCKSDSFFQCSDLVSCEIRCYLFF